MSQYDPLGQLKQLVVPLVAFSFVTNLAILVSPVFMMQVLDRVVPSGNMATLFLLLVAALFAVLTHSIVEYARDVAFSRISRWVEEIGVAAALKLSNTQRQTAINDVGTVSQFFRTSLATTALNLPWIPLFLFALALVHVYFVLLVAAIILLLALIRTATAIATSDISQQAVDLQKKQSQTLRDASDFHVASSVQAIADNLLKRAVSLQIERHQSEDRITSVSALKNASQGFVRTVSQLLALSLGAGLVVSGDLSAGGMIGASIIAAKTISTIEGFLNSTSDLRQSQRSFFAMRKTLAGTHATPTEISELSGSLRCSGLIYPRGDGSPPRLDRIAIELSPSECLAIIGDSGSGKTTLLHALCGIDPAPIGSTFLDESEVRTIGPATVKKQIGYLPQQARMMNGTLAENISCFDPQPEDNKIIQAARTAGVHGLISALPQGYDTDLGARPYLLSAGQKQRVALARAIYEGPKYLFLDEPNALLDAAGERQLGDTLALLKAQGTTIVMVLHRSGVMGLADKVLLLDNGHMADFGTRTEVLSRMNDGKQRLKLALNPASVLDLNDWITTQFSRHSDKEFCQKAILVATEMFNTACENGPDDHTREAAFTFTFTSETECEILLKENQTTRAAAKIPKIKSLLSHPEVNMLDLPSDEIALAVVAQLADDLTIKNAENKSLFVAVVSNKNSATNGVQTH